MKTRWHPLVVGAALAFGPAAAGLAQDVELAGGMMADETVRVVPNERPTAPETQRPPLSNELNVDTGKPIREWQRATDDWFGWRPKMEDRGVVLQASIIGDASWDITGGAQAGGSALRELINAGITIDTSRLFGWKGGTFFVNFQQWGGENGSQIVGDLQGFSNIDSGENLAQVSELWYEQILADGKLRLKAGKVDANTEFAYVENGLEFLNSSMGYSPTILGFPTYPNPATSINAFIYPNEWLYAGAGLYDGATQEGIDTGSRGPATFLGSPGALFVIGEMGVKWVLCQGALGGRLAGGGWRHSGDFERLDACSVESGTAGFYFAFDQMLWRRNPESKDDPQGIGMFAQYGWADPQLSPFEYHIGGGLTWTGIYSSRGADVLGLGVSFVRLSDEPGAGFEYNSECVVELFYKIQLLKWLSIKPDLQYIHNPGGSALHDALVGTLRLQVDL